MIDKLKFLIDASENNPKVKEVLLKIAALPEDKQDAMLNLVELLLKVKNA